MSLNPSLVWNASRVLIIYDNIFLSIELSSPPVLIDCFSFGVCLMSPHDSGHTFLARILHRFCTLLKVSYLETHDVHLLSWLMEIFISQDVEFLCCRIAIFFLWN